MQMTDKRAGYNTQANFVNYDETKHNFQRKTAKALAELTAATNAGKYSVKDMATSNSVLKQKLAAFT